MHYCNVDTITVVTLNAWFQVRFEQWDHVHAQEALRGLGDGALDRIKQLNSLDIELYEFAKSVLNQRMEMMKREDPGFQEHFNSMGQKEAVPFLEDEDDDDFEDEGRN